MTETTLAAAAPETAPETAKAPAALPKELEVQVQTIRAMIDAHNLLTLGSFPASHFQNVHNALTFLRRVCEGAVETASAHPEAHLVPELKEFNDKKKASPVTPEAPNGQA